MAITFRQESSSDYEKVSEVIEEAFENVNFSDHREQFLVERLRKSNAFIPELSIVAELKSKIVGHILLTKIKIQNEKQTFPSLAMAPVSVIPHHQNQGIGGKLILAAHEKAKDLGYLSIIVLGHGAYYPRFGYQLTRFFGIELPFEAPEENCLAIELQEGSLKNVNGKVIYPKEFFE